MFVVVRFALIFGSFAVLQTAANVIRNISDCSITENGILQYRGKHSVSKFGHECLNWTEFDEIFLNVFNETKNDLAENFCRNPTLNVTGPWCFVRNDETIEMEGCDVCQSLTHRPIFDEEDEDQPNDLRQAWRGYGVLLREKFVEILRRLKEKWNRFTSKLFS